MKTRYFTLAVAALTAIVTATFRLPQTEENLRRLSLKENVRFKIGALNTATDFTRLGDTDETKIDADLAQFKVERVSAAFISKDRNYVLTFAKDSNGDVKRIVFSERNGEMHAMGDDVTEVGLEEIKSAQGSVSVAAGSLLADD